MVKACRKASKILIRDFGEVEKLQVSLKGPGDFVTASDKKVEEIPTIIQNSTTNPKKPHNVIGIRTSDYKYYRSVENSKKSITLFDLKNDPSENNNIAEQQKPIVENMEKLLSDFLSKSTADDIKQLDDEKLDIVADELKKLGYA